MSQTLGSAAPLRPATKTSGLAIASLVCGIVGFCTVGLGSIAGVILGVMGLGRITRSCTSSLSAAGFPATSAYWARARESITVLSS